ncbi:hypothetical protein BgiBS90_016540, partial [Biomphalaria glabrata]
MSNQCTKQQSVVQSVHPSQQPVGSIFPPQLAASGPICAPQSVGPICAPISSQWYNLCTSVSRSNLCSNQHQQPVGSIFPPQLAASGPICTPQSVGPICAPISSQWSYLCTSVSRSNLCTNQQSVVQSVHLSKQSVGPNCAPIS